MAICVGTMGTMLSNANCSLSTIDTPLCKLDEAPDFDWVDVDKYVKSPGYGNCDHAGHLSMWNPMFANKAFMYIADNKISSNFSFGNSRCPELISFVAFLKLIVAQQIVPYEIGEETFINES
ncbi:hypothetical protein BGZ76_000735 [Entomortierella beljakovae]|nr:hypothetical protein BGZ76_000735 [Entomortierella beljakovae]